MLLSIRNHVKYPGVAILINLIVRFTFIVKYQRVQVLVVIILLNCRFQGFRHLLQVDVQVLLLIVDLF